MNTNNRNEWVLIDILFKEQGLVAHHLNSFAYYLQTIIPETILDTPPFIYENDNYRFTYQYTNTFIHKPGVIEHDGTVTNMLPNEARNRSLVYASPLFVQVTKNLLVKSTNKNKKTEEIFPLAMIPMMIKSVQCYLYKATTEELVKAKECMYEQGGYFITNGGTEKVLVGMKRTAINQPYVFSNKKNPDDITCTISSIEEKARKPPSIMNIHLVPVSYSGRRTIKVEISYFKKEFPLGILFRALGYTGKIKSTFYKSFAFNALEKLKQRELQILLENLDEDIFYIITQENAFEYLAKISMTQGSNREKSNIYTHSVLQKEFLPHIGIDETSYTDKVIYLGYMVHKLLQTYYGLREYDDHDHSKNKRTDESGILCGMIFKQAFHKHEKELHMMLKKKLDGTIKEINLSPLVNNTGFSKDLQVPLSTGNWAVIRSAKMKTGVSQLLNRFNYQATLSHCRRNTNPMPKNSVLSKPRQINTSSWGTECCIESPEGSSIGLINNKTLVCHITIPSSDFFIYELIKKYNTKSSMVATKECQWLILLNGKIVGWYQDNKLYNYLRSMKTKNIIPYDTGICIYENVKEIYIYTDGGRTARPLFIVEDKKIKLTEEYLQKLKTKEKVWDDLFKDSILEMVDSGEQESLLVAIHPDDLQKDIAYTHIEINDALIVGVCSSIIPYGNSNPSARLVFQSGMNKQATAIPKTNINYSMDTATHILNYPQKPLCQTEQMGVLNFNELPTGENAVVGICNFAWNMEDALIINQASLDRGMFRTIFERVYKETECKIVGKEVFFGLPPPTDPSFANCHKCDIDGIVKKGVRVYEDDIIISKMVTVQDDENGECIKPRGIYVKKGEEGVIADVMITVNPDGNKTVKVKIRQERRPEVGDKFASAPAQKGVIGLIVRQEDMPFTQDGITPDILINACSEASRSTTGRIKEIRSGKIAALAGRFINATMFNSGGKKEMEDLGEELKKLGYNRYGWEKMTNGTTGEIMEGLIYTGVCYYQRLKHMVADKIHVRGYRGPIASLTRQALDGRGRGGGLRVGEMERDNLISHGCSFTLQEILFYTSDYYQAPVCSKCGFVAIGDPKKKKYLCRGCKGSSVYMTEMPYVLHLLQAELAAAHIAMRIQLEK